MIALLIKCSGLGFLFFCVTTFLAVLILLFIAKIGFYINNEILTIPPSGTEATIKNLQVLFLARSCLPFVQFFINDVPIYCFSICTI